MKGFLSLLLATSLLMTFTHGINVSATNGNNYPSLTQQEIDQSMGDENLQYLISNFLDSPERLGLTEQQVINSKLGQPFSLARVTENSIKNNDAVKHFPIYSNEEMIALLTMSKSDTGEIAYSISQAYAPEIQQCLYENSSSIALLTDENVLYAINESNEIKPVFSFKDDSAASAYSINNDIELLKYSDVNFGSNTLTEESKLEKSSILVKSRQVVNNGYDWYVWPIQELRQSTDYSCWATGVAVMAKYEMPNQYSYLTDNDVMSRMMHCATANKDKISETFNAYFPKPYVTLRTGSAATAGNIQAIIQNDDPALLWLENTNGRTAHVIVLAGYRTNAPGSNMQSIWVMDPALGRTVLKPYSGLNTVYTNDESGNTYNWTDTFRFYYNYSL